MATWSHDVADGRRHFGRSAVALLAGAVSVAIIAPASLSGIVDSHPYGALAGVSAAVSLVIAGAALVHFRRSEAAGWCLVAAGVLWAGNTWVGQGGLSPLISWTVSSWVWLALGLAIAVYPAGVPWGRQVRWCFVAACVYLDPAYVALAIVAEPTWVGFPRDSVWPTVRSDRALFEVLSVVVGLVGVVIAGWFLRLTVLRARHTNAFDRAALTPTVWAVSGAAIVSSLASLRFNLAPSAEGWAEQNLIQSVALLTLPLAVGTTGLLLLLARGRIADLVLELANAAAGADETAVREVLRRTLRDPELEIYSVRAADRGASSPHDTTVGDVTSRAVLSLNTGSGE